MAISIRKNSWSSFGGMLNVLFNWIATDCRVPANKMVDEIMIVLTNLANQN
ncbi:hypothetical protein [Companilactobacillus ginsenosidimutans]|uniref:hypothetical protein n=1 Tax=Companilactobacillus ginsenosidimutans TaxID=1007676 RepID=UPI000A664B5C|nr:hypothetical protein [Companilactobacillus ginsenosidimutans]